VIVPEVRELMNAVIPLIMLAKKLVEVEFVVLLLVAKKLVEEELVVIRLLIVADATVRSVIVVVAKVEVPFTVNLLVTVDVPAVKLIKSPLSVKKVLV
jgi:hypothetical protein